MSGIATPLSPTLTESAGKAHREAFCTPAAAEVFQCIVGPNEIWKADPYDVLAIHAPARETFDRLLNRATSDPPSARGQTLLLLGEAGSGKTHLMRAFRQAVQSRGLGYCGYLQMTSMVSNYYRYILSKLLDSLEQPYCDPDNTTPGLIRLSTSLLESLPELSETAREQLREGSLEELHRWIFELADRIIALPRFRGCDLNLVRVLLHLQHEDPRIKHRVLCYLRAEDLLPADRALLGGLAPRCQEQDAQNLIFQLGRLMAAVDAALVLLVDQLEDLANTDEAGVQQFRRAIDALTTVGESVPSSIVVIACLEDYFTANRGHLPKPRLDRLLIDPPPHRLNSHCDRDEVLALVQQRLLALYDRQELPCNDLPDCFPFTAQHLAPLAGMRTRDVLTHCLRHQQRCAGAGRWLEPQWDSQPPAAKPPAPPAPDTTGLEQLWNDFQTACTTLVPEEESLLAGLLRWAVEQVSQEMRTGHHFAAEVEGRLIAIEIHGPDNSVDKLLAAICNRAPQGGGLGRQISEVEKRTGEIPAALLRCTAFPHDTLSQVGKQLAGVVKKGGRLIQVEDADWRKILALQQFCKLHGKRPDFGEWLRDRRPLSQLPSLRRLLALDSLASHAPTPAPSPAPTPKDVPPPAPTEIPAAAGPLRLGERRGLLGGAVTLEVEALNHHAAFLGATGSGKTTAALNVIEQLLLRGIPAILVDRKGDLCRYADPAAWGEPLADPAAAERRRQLRDQLDVAVYTPGTPAGRPLKLPVVPAGIDRLPTSEREQLVSYAAAALGGMLGYSSRSHAARLAILRKAIEVLSEIPELVVTVAGLHRLIDSRDDALLTAVGGGFEDRQYRQLAQDLLALRINNQQLIEGSGELLDIDALLGKGSGGSVGRTRLSVLSTRFLGSLTAVEFWVAQFLAALNRWMGKSPSAKLQMVVLFDEADLYLPAVRQPATKAPLENLLRRGRSAGLGILLATQSPGDLDYRCRDNIHTWLVGQIKEEPALRKLKPMFTEANVDPAAVLPGQGTGQLHLLRGKEVISLSGQPALLRTEQLPEPRILELARVSKR